MMENDNSDKHEGVKFLGKNIAEIPCFRDSYFYGICTGLLGGFAYFMFTSRVAHATHFSVGSFAISTLSYWTYCRMNYERKEKEAQLMNRFLKEQIMNSGMEDKVNEPVTV